MAIYSDSSDIMGGYNRGTVTPTDTLSPTPITGLLNPIHLQTLGNQPEYTDINLREITEPTQFQLEPRSSTAGQRILRLPTDKHTSAYLTLSDGLGMDSPYIVRSSNATDPPPPQDGPPVLLLHVDAPELFGSTTMLNAIPGHRVKLDGPAVRGTGLLQGVTYPIANGYSLTPESISAEAATIWITPPVNRPLSTQVTAHANDKTAQATITWKGKHTVTAVTALWRNKNQEVMTRTKTVTPGQTSITMKNLPLLSGQGGWKFSIRTGTPSTSVLTTAIYTGA